MDRPPATYRNAALIFDTLALLKDLGPEGIGRQELIAYLTQRHGLEATTISKTINELVNTGAARSRSTRRTPAIIVPTILGTAWLDRRILGLPVPTPDGWLTDPIDVDFTDHHPTLVFDTPPPAQGQAPPTP